MANSQSVKTSLLNTGRAPPRIGPRLRARRVELGIGQAALARAVGISPSYLHLIEHNRRSVAGALLLRLSEQLRLAPDTLSGRTEARLAAELREAAPAIDPARIPDLITASPELAAALVALHREGSATREKLRMLSERLADDPFLADASHRLLTLVTSIRSFSEILQDYADIGPADRARFTGAIGEESTRLAEVARALIEFLGGRAPPAASRTPEEEVEDLLHDRRNHFPGIESAATAMRAELDATGRPLFAALVERLQLRHGISVRFVPDLAANGYDAAGRELLVSDALAVSSWRFQAARLLARLEVPDVIEAETAALATPEGRARGRAFLESAFAGAVLMPYEAFAEAARACRHDIELLEHRFAASFEQVCHRLASLGRPGTAVPFHFLRTDIAGNISKRFSATSLHLPRHGGACPRWASHTAFLTPGRIVTQLARLPDGATYLFVARAFSRPGQGFRSPRTHHSVMIGCEAAHARQVVYADALDLGQADTPEPVGVTCRLCPLAECGQRAAPSLQTAP
jgi:predicted transcriptional regulator/transcriptional regulator with XRE-family HTH domain